MRGKILRSIRSLRWVSAFGLAVGVVLLAACNPERSRPVDVHARASLCASDDTECQLAEEFAVSYHGKTLEPEIVDRIFFAQAPCFRDVGGKAEPQQAELDNYHARKNGPSEVMRGALNPHCVMPGYAAEEIETWAGRGDPVAEYVLSYVTLRENGCKTFPQADRLLKNALAAKSDIPGDLNLRVPEAGYALARSADYCLSIPEAVEYRQYLITAIHGGFVAPLAPM